MQTDWLADFLHLHHALATHGGILQRLLGHFDGDPARLRASPPSTLRALDCSERAIARLGTDQAQAVKRDLAWAAEDGNSLVCFDDPRYPDLLRQIPDFPALLYVSGDARLLQELQIAIVGSRLCTPGGSTNAFEFAAELAAAGFVVTSGMALGIDAEAHRGALEAGGRTIAVTATGGDRVYPAANRALDRRIRAVGALVTEFPPGTAARRANFPQRNRIISGLALGTLVVEAAERSGSLITARLAAEQGREVFAIPGSIHNPLCRGCHALLRDGAWLVETPADIARELGRPFAGKAIDGSRRQTDGLDSEHRRLLEAVGYDPVSHDELVARSGLTIDKLSSMLLVLELNEFIQSAPGGRFVRI